MSTKWTDEDTAAAADQGWNVFEAEDGTNYIGREEDKPIFKSDADAEASVRSRAFTGYLLQKKALEFIDPKAQRSP